MKILFSLAFLIAMMAISYSNPMVGKLGGEDFSLLDKLKIVEKYAKLIEQEGVKAWHFIECMGVDWALHCVQPTLACLATKSLPGCIELVSCEGKSAKTCAPKFA